jgi:hypothetical protein
MRTGSYADYLRDHDLDPEGETHAAAPDEDRGRERGDEFPTTNDCWRKVLEAPNTVTVRTPDAPTEHYLEDSP